MGIFEKLFNKSLAKTARVIKFLEKKTRNPPRNFRFLGGNRDEFLREPTKTGGGIFVGFLEKKKKKP